MADIPKRVALVYDRVNKWGGAERVLLALHEIFPQAPLYTAVYNPETAQWAKVFPQVISSFLQYFPKAKSHHELYPWLTPLAFESLNLDQYEAVISITSADAKGVITKPSTFHLCYCLTPTRYLWSHQDYYKSQTSSILHPIFSYLKSWDLIASRRPDTYITISQTVQNRVSSYYHQPSSIVYPPVDVDRFTPTAGGEYFLSVGRMVGYKQPETLVNLFNELNLPLIMIGAGNQKNRLRPKPNIKLLGFASETELVSLFQNAKALISVHEEDFGIVYAEAQAAGKPVLALNAGGVKEVITHDQTGYLAKDLDDLKSAIINFDHRQFNHLAIKQSADRFSKERFKSEFVKVFRQEWIRYNHTYSS
ncbi:hypothetical protein A3D85_02425 [Candidatus Amesbacteria bacterium RIFCSPHIGHO2_02_FULL_47_9]|uniref:Glycosyl transferase family 1 domain-containing protein n=1 Tax=Candidatus Amesbacteria bacterium RIFCSPHIGHO2_01_FULL_48_32b TaxID=1797253 RepID=A0A1F4YDE5_9BACT|nr:MAG: hypothetical protein A2876_03395 [Candidatus Amesbacteria bacterium RIFCSPHIGHO2_01_FULL_48_32b]OGD02323.1 MAG: hypothetical protein A3D85_02425 [Candidatus Amesbacteria bacterium RIFCSPHIGHO2_02_FULL_47_9]OGD08496.1 MAG: hypothetical protein A2899_01735 [Candidatus Amesbacteria bacterium RIFCSPLOWO2_01_FULL_49_25]